MTSSRASDFADENWLGLTRLMELTTSKVQTDL